MVRRRSRYYKRKLYFGTQDRILLHLLEYVGREGEINQPDDLTQFGIADAIGLGRSTVSKAVRGLEQENLLTPNRAHVPSGKLRRTVYLLTGRGISRATRRRMDIEEEVVVFRDAEHVDRRQRLSQVPLLLPDYASLLDIIVHISEGVFDATTFRPRRRGFVDLTDRLPQVRHFVGRAEELRAMDTWLKSPTLRVLVMTGLTGIGKTTLIARKLEEWRGTRHLFFHRIMAWTTLRNLLQQTAELLARLGRKHLAQYLDATPLADLEEVVSIMSRDLHDVPAVLVYDDYHNAEPRIRELFTGLLAALDEGGKSKVLIAGRFVPPFYDRRDVRVHGTVQELRLGGLDAEGTERLLEARNLALTRDQVAVLYRMTRGHPLFLELVDSASLSASQDVHKYLEEELLARITDAEAKTLTIASVFRYPVHADGLFVDESVDSATVRGLVDQSLLREVTSNVYEVHDALRMFFNRLMTPVERRRYNRWAAQFLLSRPDGDPLESLFHLIEAGETTSAARLAVKDGRAMIGGGRSEELFRLLERLLPSVEDLAHGVELRLLKARIFNVRGELDQAVALYGEILRLPNEPDLKPKIAEAHRSLGDILRRENHHAEAKVHLDSASRVYRSLGNEGGQAETLLALGQLEEDRADHGRAEKYYQKSLSLARRLDLEALQAEALTAFSRILHARGDLVRALDRGERALGIAEALPDWHLQARLKITLGAILFGLKRYDEAMQAYHQGIETARRIGDLRILAYGLYNASGALIRRNELLRAEVYLRECETLVRKLREPVMEALVLHYSGTLWEARGKWPVAKRNFVKALDLLGAGGHSLDLARTAIHAAFYFNKNGERAAATKLLDQAIDVGRRLHIPGIVEEARQNSADILGTGRRAQPLPSAPDGATSF